MARIKELSRVEVLAPYPTQRLAKNGSIKNITMTATALINESDKTYEIATTERALEPTINQCPKTADEDTL